MKVLFALGNDSMSKMIIKRYQEEYKQIISERSVYYFNAILKELQRDKTYDRIIISEELEAFSNTQYEQIDKFIREKLDKISDEAATSTGGDTPIILLCADRRTKSEEMLSKLFSMGIYNALIGPDRSIEEVCKLLDKPRTKKEAKDYYRITESETYVEESENTVSEVEIQNILAHYKRLGDNPDRFIDSFNNIAAQYNDAQLRIIGKVLPLNVRAVLEERSQKYQQIMSFKVSDALRQKEDDDREPLKAELLKTKIKKMPMDKPIVMPTEMNMGGVQKLSTTKRTVNLEQPQRNNVQEYQGRPIGQRPMAQNQNTIKQQEYSRPIPHQQQPQQIPVQRNVVNQNINFEQQENVRRNIEQNQQQRQTVVTPKIPVQSPVVNEIKEEPVVEKRRRGRPPKNRPVQVQEIEDKPKKKRGRPPKNAPVQEIEQPTILPGFNENIEEQTAGVLPGFEDVPNNEIGATLPGFENIEEPKQEAQADFLPGFEADEETTSLPGFEDYNTNEVEEETSTLPGFENNPYVEPQTNIDPYANNNLNQYEPEPSNDPYANNNTNQYEPQPSNDPYANNNASQYEVPMNNEPYINQYSANSNVNKYDYSSSEDNYTYTAEKINKKPEYINTIDISSLLTPEKKIASFLGTSKNGTSFIVNNVAELLSSMGIKTAILDTTKNRNSYYIYTKNDEALRKTAETTLENLANGMVQGINVNKNLTVFTSLPDNSETIYKVDEILATLVKEYSLVLIDTDFDTPIGYFKQSQELYLIQTLDILTIQPLTAFLRELKEKNVLEESKLRIIINKAVRVKGITEKTIIGGMAFYNDPAMAFMTDLFDRNMVKYITIPFEDETYVKYLENVINCEITLKGYSKIFMQSLRELGSLIYPITTGKGGYKPQTSGYSPQSSGFSPTINSTLDQMKRNY